MDERRPAPTPAVGGSSLLVIFAVLALTVFALLTLTTVQADGRLADASAQAVTDYYAADCAAEAILARLRAGEVPPDVTADGDTYYYNCPISETQALSVAVQVTETGYTVLRWQAVSTVDWAAEDPMTVWDGQ